MAYTALLLLQILQINYADKWNTRLREKHSYCQTSLMQSCQTSRKQMPRCAFHLQQSLLFYTDKETYLNH